jgi:hypothetical protein
MRNIELLRLRRSAFGSGVVHSLISPSAHKAERLTQLLRTGLSQLGRPRDPGPRMAATGLGGAGNLKTRGRNRTTFFRHDDLPNRQICRRSIQPRATRIASAPLGSPSRKSRRSQKEVSYRQVKALGRETGADQTGESTNRAHFLPYDKCDISGASYTSNSRRRKTYRSFCKQTVCTGLRWQRRH